MEVINMKDLRIQIDSLVNGNGILANLYRYMMLLAIIVSIIPLMLIKCDDVYVSLIETVTVYVFIFDYFARWIIYDSNNGNSLRSYLLYPFTPMAIIDLLSILPAFNILGSAFKIARITRIFKLIKIFRIVKVLHYSERIAIFFRVIAKEKDVLVGVLMLALLYIFITALIMFNVEPHINPDTGLPTFNSFFDALYWATVTLTTVGYGDLCPVTDIGRFISMLSSLLGVAVIALPSGVITASYLDELRHRNETQEKK